MDVKERAADLIAEANKPPAPLLKPMAAEKINTMLMYFGLLSIIGGVIGCYLFWPGDPEYGYRWKPVAYTASMVCIVAGVVQWLLFNALGNILLALARIAENTSKAPPA